MGLEVLNKGHNRTVGDIILLFWAAKFYIFGLMLLLGSLSIVWLCAQDDVYRARMLVGPVDPLFSSVDKALYEAQDAYNATPLYMMKRRDSSVQFQQFLKTMHSEAASHAVLSDLPNILPYFKGERDRALPLRTRYEFDGAYSDALQLSHILKNRVNIQPEGLTPFYQITITMNDRALAPELLAALHRVSDHQLRAQARLQVNANIAYLKQRIITEKNRDYRKLLTSLILQEEYSLMALQNDGVFSAKVVESPHISPYVVWPKPFMVMGTVVLISFMFGSVLFGFVSGLRHRKA